MKQFTSVKDTDDINALLHEAGQLKKHPFTHQVSGLNKTLGLVFMNPSLRTRLSTQKAARNLGLDVIVLNITQEGWKLEMQDGAIMNGDTVEHIKDAAAVLGSYCDIIGVRCFPGLVSREADYSEQVMHQFMRYCKRPFISLESATLHPLQSLADAMTIRENWKEKYKPKVVLTWAPHIKPLPQAVPNSFAEWMCRWDQVDLVICHPPGYELCGDFTDGAVIRHQQEEALEHADFVYIKNWSAYTQYGAMPEVSNNWLMTEEKLNLTHHAKIMHCLPVRRNVELTDELLDGPASLVLQQAENRVFAAQVVLKRMLEHIA